MGCAGLPRLLRGRCAPHGTAARCRLPAPRRRPPHRRRCAPLYRPRGRRRRRRGPAVRRLRRQPALGGATVTLNVCSATPPSAPTARTASAWVPGVSRLVSQSYAYGGAVAVARTVPSTTNSTRATAPLVSTSQCWLPDTV